MGDPRRFDAFAKLARKHIAPSAAVVDIAGGKGYLQAAMRQLGYRTITSWDKRKRCATGRAGYRYGWFDHRTAPCYDAVVAMHPDEGTDHAILYAAEHHCTALVCPCCVKPSAIPFWGNHDYKGWCEHLAVIATKAGASVQWTTLPIVGRSAVLIVNPGASA